MRAIDIPRPPGRFGRSLATLGLALLWSVCARVLPGQAAWSTDPAVNLALCTDPHAQSWPVIVGDAMGGWIVVWVDQRAVGAKTDINAQRIDAAGNVLWLENGVPVSDAANDQGFPAALGDQQGGAFVVWVDRRTDALGDIYAQRIGSNGQLMWNATGLAIAASVNTSAIYPNMCDDGANGAILTWIERRSSSFDLYAQRLDAAGAPQWLPGGVVLSTVLSWPSTRLKPFPAISDGAGGAFCAVSFTGAASYDLRIQRVNAAGARQWGTDGAVACIAGGTQRDPVLAADGAGGVFMAWTDLRGTAEDIFGQRFSPTGMAQWGTNGEALCGETGTQDIPAIAADGGTGCVLAWRDFRTAASGADIYAQRIDAAAARQWDPAGVPVCTAPQVQTGPVLAPAVGAGWLCAWQDLRSDAGNVYAQKLDSAGHALWDSTGVAVCTAANAQSEISLQPVADGGVTLAWTDARTLPTTDIYAQRVSAAGALFGGATGVDVGPAGDQPDWAQADGPAGSLRLEWTGSNPARVAAEFRVVAARTQMVSLVVYDLRGRRVREVYSGALAAGARAWRWDGRDVSGRAVASGVYRLVLRADAGERDRVFVLTR